VDIICRKRANDMVYAYHAGRFWRWDGSLHDWKESHLMAAKFERARAAVKALTPEAFFSDGAEFAQLNDYEITPEMAEALKNAVPCKNAPIDPVQEDSTLVAPAACICSTCTCGGCKEECFSNCRNCGHPVQECNSYQTEGEKRLTAAHSADVAPSFDFSVLGDLSEQAADADQQFDLHYGAAQDEYLISCIYLARIHALTAKAGRYGGGTWTKWYESKGLSEGSARTMVKNGEAFNSATVAELKCLPELTRKDLNLIARSGRAEQLVEAAGDSQRVQELLEQLKTEKARAENALAEIGKRDETIKSLLDSSEAADARADSMEAQYKATLADVQGLKNENAQLATEKEQAEVRAKNAEEALKKQPITGVVDKEEVQRQAKALASQWREEEIDRLAADKSWGLADARNAEIQADKDKLEKDKGKLEKDKAALQKQVAALSAQLSDRVQTDFEISNSMSVLFWAVWNNGEGSYSRLVGEDLESTFINLCETLDSIKEEMARRCRQPQGYDGGEGNE